MSKSKKPKPIAGKGRIGAIVRYCGHNATFVADVITVGDACVVIANGDIDDCLMRPATKATHHLIDFPVAGYWQPRKGIFVVPSDQVVLL